MTLPRNCQYEKTRAVKLVLLDLACSLRDRRVIDDRLLFCRVKLDAVSAVFIAMVGWLSGSCADEGMIGVPLAIEAISQQNTETRRSVDTRAILHGKRY